MRILPTKFNQNFTKRKVNAGGVTLDRGKAYDSETRQPYSGQVKTRNLNGDVSLWYNNGLLAQSTFYKPNGIEQEKLSYERDVKDYCRLPFDKTRVYISTYYDVPWGIKSNADVEAMQEFYPNGKIKRAHKLENNTEKIKTFHKNGQLESSIIIQHNRNNSGLKSAYFYSSNGTLEKKILPYRDENGHRVVQNEYDKDGNITKSTKAYFIAGRNPDAQIPVDKIGELIPYEVVEFDEKGKRNKKHLM